MPFTTLVMLLRYVLVSIIKLFTRGKWWKNVRGSLIVLYIWVFDCKYTGNICIWNWIKYNQICLHHRYRIYGAVVVGKACKLLARGVLVKGINNTYAYMLFHTKTSYHIHRKAIPAVDQNQRISDISLYETSSSRKIALATSSVLWQKHHQYFDKK